MGYAKRSKRPIKRVEDILKQMVKAEGEIRFKVEDAEETAYRIREAFAASKHFASHGEPYVSYANLKAKFVIRSNGNIVTCEPRDYVPSMQVRNELATVTIPGVKDVLGIIGAAIAHKSPRMLFPDAVLSFSDLERLAVWGEKNHYKLNSTEAGITLTRDDDTKEHSSV